MRRTLLIVVLGLGTVLGYASGFAHLHAWRHGGHARWCQHAPPQDAPPPASP